MSVSEFDAFRIFEADGKVEGRIVKATLDELSEGEVVIRTAYSSVNYKDALAATGTGKIVRNFPLIGGIDVAGSVVSSTDSAFGEGDERCWSTAMTWVSPMTGVTRSTCAFPQNGSSPYRRD